MIDPNEQLQPGQRVSLPHETVSQVVSILLELPARVSMDAVLAVRQQAEVVEAGHEEAES